MKISQTVLVEKWGVTKGRISQLVKRGMPLDSVESAEEWRRKYATITPKEKAPKNPDIPDPPTEVALDLKTISDPGIEGLLGRAIEEELAAYSLVTRAFKANELAALPLALRAHREAQKNRMEAHDRVEDARLRNKETITMAGAKSVISSVLNQIRAALLNAPSTLCSKLDPTRAEHARRVVDEWVQGMMTQINAGESQLGK
jgi:hypothetical protein